MDGKRFQAGDFRSDGGRIAPLDEINRQMVMITSPGKKTERAPIRGQLQLQRFVEFLSVIEVANGKVQVA